ncbi:dual specificity protein phosphatase family protein [Pareuzebyella sediminis]|uniref:dual specificity protein phosphatase family protein n=1 Tax=Pareuzebyella sediminis TaxID=2607998 RepID=UPI0011EE45B4|nr:dual specificity protein phosphatase family protein [Pareuzebyella sediminis]
MSGLFESHFMDIVSFIEENGKVMPHKESGATASLSIGGFQIMHTSRYYPNTFD